MFQTGRQKKRLWYSLTIVGRGWWGSAGPLLRKDADALDPIEQLDEILESGNAVVPVGSLQLGLEDGGVDPEEDLHTAVDRV